MAEDFDYEIVKLSENLIDNLGLTKPASAKNYQDLLSSDDFYIEVYRALMTKAGTAQFDRSKFDKETRGCSVGERIQSLINKLAHEVLQVDLSHIKGEKIAKGNKKNISDMLQLLDALWHNLNQDGDTGAEDGEEEQMVEHIDSDINRHESFNQEQELNRASNSEYRKNDKAHSKPQHDAIFAKMMQDGKMPPGSIPVYSEDPINYGGIELQPKYNKHQARAKKNAVLKPVPDKKTANRAKSAGLASKKHEVVRRIESNVFGLRRDKLSKEVKLIKPQNAPVNDRVVREFRRLEKHGDGIAYDPAAVNAGLSNIRDYLDGKRAQTSVHESLQNKKLQYKKELQDYISQNKKVEEAKLRKAEEARKTSQKDRAKALDIYQSKVQEGLAYHEKAAQLRNRDEEVRYMRNINKIIFNMKKNRAIEDKKHFKEDREVRVKDTCDVIQSVENFYKDRISLLKERIAQEKTNRRQADYAQRRLLTGLEKELKVENRKQMEDLVSKWQAEKERLNLLKTDDDEMQQQLIKLFKKYQLF